LDFAHPGSSSHCNVFLATLGTMCHLSLEVWTNTLSVLFVYLLVLFLSVYKFFSFCLMLCCYLGTTYIVTVDCMSLVCLTCLNIAYH
jgi:hypothetical protein